ncbi:hypothetical protein JD844_021314, partial [Phrynosoma platyrhinos]
NVLELKVCDEDGLLGDDLLCAVLFDIAHLQPGETVSKHFELNEQARYSRKGYLKWSIGGKRLTFTVKGSYENTQDIVLDSHARCVPPGPIMFNYAKYCCPQMEVVSTKKRSFCVSNCHP